MKEPGEKNYDSKQKEILTIAARLFNAKGYERTSLGEIAAAAGLKKGSLYYYFQSKQEILAQISTKGLERTLEHIIAVKAETLPVAEKMRKLIYTYVLEMTDNLDFISVCFKEEGSLEEENRRPYLHEQDILEEVFLSTIREGIDSGDFNPVDPKLATFLIFGACHHIIRWYKPGGPYTPEHMAREFSRYLCELMLTKK